ncbi:MAG TPA: hypothetical protein VGR16_14470 [Thermomicrobiales bacterium]|nr:hypothetical protein [Thermomicrobiales bacterium]
MSEPERVGGRAVVHHPGRARWPGPLWAWGIAGILGEMVILAVLTLLLFPGIWQTGSAVFDEDQSAGPERGVTLSEVVDHPEPMWGEIVTVSAEVDTLIDPYTMLIGNRAPIVGDILLVVSAAGRPALRDQAAPTPLTEDDVVQVTGVVRHFDIPALEAETGVDLNETALTSYGHASAMVALAIHVNPPAEIGPGDPEYGGSAGPDTGVTIRDVGADPEQYLGQTVEVSGEIEYVYGPHAYWLEDGGALVVSATPHPEAFDETSAFVRGEVRRFDIATLEAELGIDLNDQELRHLEGGPVIIAESFQLVK